MKWILFLFLVSPICFAQKTDQGFNLVADDFYGVDDFDAVYYGKNDVFYKKTSSGTLQFYDIQLGDLTEVDLINPLKILLFYRETQTVVLLDNRLNEKERIVLNDLTPFRYFEHVQLAGERRLWLHDLDNNRLELYDYINDRTLISTAALQKNVIELIADYNFCHVLNDEVLETYNTYGSKTSTLSIKDADFIDYDFETLVVLKDDVINVWKMGKEFRFRESETIINLLRKKEKSENQTTNYPPNQNTDSSPSMVKENQEKDIKSLYLKGGKLYIWRGKRVSVYKINPDKK